MDWVIFCLLLSDVSFDCELITRGCYSIIVCFCLCCELDRCLGEAGLFVACVQSNYFSVSGWRGFELGLVFGRGVSFVRFGTSFPSVCRHVAPLASSVLRMETSD